MYFECGQRLRAGAGSVGAFGERVVRCPGCDVWLYYGLGIESSDQAHPG